MRLRIAFTTIGLVLSTASYAQEKSTQDLLSSIDKHPYNQIFTIQGGVFHPSALSVSNSSYQFRYEGNSLNSYWIEPGWSLKLFHFLGSVYIQENLVFSTFRATVPSKSDSLSLFMMGIDTRLKHAWEWFPLRAVVPFVEVGYQYTLYSQSGSSDYESAQGAVGNFDLGAGIDLWINSMFSTSHDNVNRYDSVPFFLTAKVNRIVSKGSEVDLGSTTFLFGLSIGI